MKLVLPIVDVYLNFQDAVKLVFVNWHLLLFPNHQRPEVAYSMICFVYFYSVGSWGCCLA